jgi:hypothetical protein
MVFYDGSDWRSFQPYSPRYSIPMFYAPGGYAFLPEYFPYRGTKITCQSRNESEIETIIPSSWPLASYTAASCCDAMLSTWSRESVECEYRQTAPFYSYFTFQEEWVTRYTTAFCNGTFTTLCDGWPRALCSPTEKQLVGQRVLIEETTSCQTTSSSVSTVPILRPNCTVAAEDCSRLWDVFLLEMVTYQRKLSIQLSQLKSEYLENVPKFNNTYKQTTSRLSIPYVPNCSRGHYFPCRAPCRFAMQPIEILYFPVNSDEIDLDELLNCSRNISEPGLKRISQISPLISHNRTRVAIWKGHTLTSPSVYAYIPTMSHLDHCGGLETDILLPLNLKDGYLMTAILRWPVMMDGKERPARDLYNPWTHYLQFNSTHLAYSTVGNQSYPLVPRDKYYADMRCFEFFAPCRTIYHDFQPLALFTLFPQDLSQINPLWQYCGTVELQAHDPAIAVSAKDLYDIPPAQLTTYHTVDASTVEPRASPSFFVPTQTGIPHEPTDSVRDSADPTQVQPGGESEPKGSSQQGDAQSSRPKQNAGENREQGGVVTVLVSTIFIDSLGNSEQDYMEGGDQTGQPKVFGENIDSERFRHRIQDLAIQTQAVFAVDEHQITAIKIAPGSFMIESQTFSQGGTPITINGARVSAMESGVVIYGPKVSKDGGYGETALPSRELGGQASDYISQSSEGISSETQTSNRPDMDDERMKQRTSSKGKKNVGQITIEISWAVFSCTLILIFLIGT